MSARLYIVAGCNGAGKTTASFSLLPKILDCEVFINADEIARELNPENVARVAFEAGRMMLEQINERIRNGETFAFETTLAARSYKETILLAQAMGYHVTLIFFGYPHLRWQSRVLKSEWKKVDIILKLKS